MNLEVESYNNKNTNVESKYQNQSTKNNREKMLLVIIFLLIFICFIGLYQCWNKPCDCSCHTPSGQSYVPEIDKNAGEYVKPDAQNPAHGVAIPGWNQIIIPKDQSSGITVDFYNPEANKDLYYLTFEIRLPNENGEFETIYKSGLVEPGLHIQNIDLTKPLQKGEYDAIIHVQPYRMSDKSTTNNADLETKLIVR